MKILAFDTSNQPLTVSIIDGYEILTEQTINIRRNHSVQLMPAIDEALKQAHLTLDDIEKIVVASGPGSYTGLRIAVTIAKSLAWAKDIELVGVSSLKVLAGNVHQREAVIVPMFDARRNNIYTGLYKRDEENKLTQILPDTHTSVDEWIKEIAVHSNDQDILLVGSDAKKFLPLFIEKFGKNVKEVSPEQNIPRASVLGLLGLEEETITAHDLVPVYLKLAEAEENWLKEHPEFKGNDFIEKIK